MYSIDRGERPFSPLQNMILSLYLNLIRIVGQLIGMTIYPRQQSKIKLPNEEIMFYAEKLYRNWKQQN